MGVGGGGSADIPGGCTKGRVSPLPILNRSQEVGISAFLFSTLRNNT